MSVVAVTSSRTSPGATTVAAGLAIAWSHVAERSLLIEADPAGGVLGLRFDLEPSRSLASLGTDIQHRFHSDHLWASSQDLRGARCILAPVDPLLARAWIQRLSPTLIEQLPQLGVPTVVDLGWVDHDGASASLANAADKTLIVTRPDVAEIQALLFQVRRLQAMDTEVAIVTIGDSPNDPREVADLAGVPLAAVLPEDRRFAAALAGGDFKPERFRRSSLWRTINGLASTLLDEELLNSRSAARTEAPLRVTPQPDFEDLRGPLDELSPAALQLMAPLPQAPPQMRRPSSHALMAVAVPPPLDDTPAMDHAVNQMVNQAVDPAAADEPLGGPTVPPPPSAESVAAVLATGPLPPTVIDITRTPAPPSYPATALNDPALLDNTTRMHEHLAGLMASLILPSRERHLLTPDQALTIGRHSECDIVLKDSQVSRHHGRLVRTDEGWHYADLGSRNGSELNGRPCTDAVLSTGDTLMIGGSPLTFQTGAHRDLEYA